MNNIKLNNKRIKSLNKSFRDKNNLILNHTSKLEKEFKKILLDHNKIKKINIYSQEELNIIKNKYENVNNQFKTFKNSISDSIYKNNIKYKNVWNLNRTLEKKIDQTSNNINIYKSKIDLIRKEIQIKFKKSDEIDNIILNLKNKIKNKKNKLLRLQNLIDKIKIKITELIKKNSKESDTFDDNFNLITNSINNVKFKGSIIININYENNIESKKDLYLILINEKIKNIENLLININENQDFLSNWDYYFNLIKVEENNNNLEEIINEVKKFINFKTNIEIKIFNYSKLINQLKIENDNFINSDLKNKFISINNSSNEKEYINFENSQFYKFKYKTDIINNSTCDLNEKNLFKSIFNDKDKTILWNKDLEKDFNFEGENYEIEIKNIINYLDKIDIDTINEMYLKTNNLYNSKNWEENDNKIEHYLQMYEYILNFIV